MDSADNADTQTDCDTSLDESCTDIGDDVRIGDSVGDQTFLLQVNYGVTFNNCSIIIDLIFYIIFRMLTDCYLV